MTVGKLSSVRNRAGKWTIAAVLLVAALGVGHVAMDELQTSRGQAASLSDMARELRYEVKLGPSPTIRFPGVGPFDERLGYHRLPDLVERLERQDFAVSAQARMSPKMLEFSDKGLFATYREKTTTGLELRDCRGQALSAARYPEQTYDSFEAVPPLLVDSLLFIENRELLDARFPKRNRPTWSSASTSTWCRPTPS